MYQKIKEMNEMNTDIVFADYIISCVCFESQKHGFPFPITSKSEVFA